MYDFLCIFSTRVVHCATMLSWRERHFAMNKRVFSRRVLEQLVAICFLLGFSCACTADRSNGEQGHKAKPPSAETESIAIDSSGGLEPGSLDDILIEFPVCETSPRRELCERGSSIFEEKCRICHGRTGAVHRAAPTLIGLVGRQRTFLSGRSIVANEDYIRRSIVDHSSDEEYVPGYHGTLEKVQMLSHPDAALRASHRAVEERAWKTVVGPSGLSPGEVNALGAFIEWLSEQHLPSGSVRIGALIPGKRNLDARRIRQEVDLRLESIRVCYEFELEKQPNLEGEIQVAFVGLPKGRVANGKVVLDTLQKPLLARCVADAVGFATAACPVPPRDGAVRFVFAPRGTTALRPSTTAP